MRARWWINLLLLVAVAGLAVVIRFEAVRDSTPERLAGLDPADLHLIALERTGEPKLALELTPDGWRMREPFDADAEPAQVDKLLEVLAAPVYRSFPEASAAPAELGLVPARIVLKVDGLTLSFGGVDPVTQRRYVAADGLVHLIDDRFYPILIAPPLDFVSRALAARGFPPVFGTLKGVPLAASALKILGAQRAVRLESLSGDLAGDPLELKSADGAALRFLVTEDRRRLSRADLKLTYVLGDPLLLELDPTAVDTTPPAPPPPAPAPEIAAPGAAPDEPFGVSEGAGAADAPDRSEPFAPPADPDAPVPGDAPLGAPPAVHLSPDRPNPPEPPPRPRRGGAAPAGFGAEPYKEPPEGFGQDPFAPDPAEDPGAGAPAAPPPVLVPEGG